jgi:Dopey, N-terminal
VNDASNTPQDLIHDLQRVNRVLAKHSNSTHLPEKQLLSKRLAQCLTSSLPSGVHLKALETYRIVFMRIGPARLARDLPLYAGGLFPLFSYSATSLKPALLSLYESQFLPLGPSLSPLLDGLVLAILPGLEDESSEFYERSVALLDSVAIACKDSARFCRALWRGLLLVPPMRLPAANYIRSRITSENKLPWASQLLTDMPLVAHAIAAALNDRNALVQRSVLDLLLGELALDLPFFAVESEECEAAAVALVSGVFGALLRKDASLTKRVHSWFLGGLDRDRGVLYCNKHSRRWLLGAIDDEAKRASNSNLKGSGSAGQATRPCKIILGLLAKNELYSSVGQDLALRVLRFARSMLQPENALFEREVRHAVTEVVTLLGSSVIFGELERFVIDDVQTSHGGSTELDKYELLTFALLFAPVKEDVVRRQQLPALLNAAVCAVDRIADEPQVLKSAVSFCGAAMAAMAFTNGKQDEPEEVREVMPQIAATFTSFFVAWLAKTVISAPLEMRRAYADIGVEDEISAEFATASMRDETDECAVVARAACSFLTSLVASRVCGPETTTTSMQAAAKCALAGDSRVALAGARAYADIAASSSREERISNVEEQTAGVVRKTWRLLHPSLPTATASNAQVWLLLQRQFPDHVNVVVADGILSPIPGRRLRNLERFACVWRLAVEHRLCPAPADPGLFLMLDALDDRDWGPKMLARSWLSEALSTDAGAVVDAPLRLLLTPEAKTVGPSHEFAGVYDAPRALYAFQALRSVVESSMLGTNRDGGESSLAGDEESGEQSGPFNRKRGSFLSSKNVPSGAQWLSSTSPSPRTLAALANMFGVTTMSSSKKSTVAEQGPVKLTGLLPALDYVSVLTVTALGYIRGRVPDKFVALEKHPLYCLVQGGNVAHGDGHEGREVATSGASESMDRDAEWLAAGLGFAPFTELHASVAVAAAEFFAKLVSSLPFPSPCIGRLAEYLADPLMHLLTSSIANRDSVLQLHFLDAVEALVVAEGNGFPLPRTIQRKSFANANAMEQMQVSGRRSNSFVFGPSTVSQLRARIHHAGYLESHPTFLPWVLAGVSQAFKAPADGRDIGSQEVLGLRRRWIRFVATILMHAGASLPMLAEGTVLLTCRLLGERNVDVEYEDAGQLSSQTEFHESEFSRIDERLLLLKGLASFATTAAASFAYSVQAGLLCDDISVSDLSNDLENGASRTHGASRGEDDSRPWALSAYSRGSNVDTSNGAGLLGSKNSGNGTLGAAGVDSAAGGSLASAATMSMMSAINSPFRMLNDFVKDVFTGSASDGLAQFADPRRNAARVLYMHLPALIYAVVQTWGPQKDLSLAPTRSESQLNRTTAVTLIESSRVSRNAPIPRLSRELPRERRRAQREAVLGVVEPLFASRPTDVIAAIVTLFCGSNDVLDGDSACLRSRAIDMLRALDLATPEIVVSCAAEILELAMKWDLKSVSAEEGRVHMERRFAATKAVANLVYNGLAGGLDDLDAVRKGSMDTGTGAPRGGGKTGDDSNVTSIAALAGTPLAAPRPYAVKLFHAGDFFAAHRATDVETAVLRFLEQFFQSCDDGDEVQSSWPFLHVISKEVQASHKRKASITCLARALAAFASCDALPQSDKVSRKQLMTVSAAVLGTCSSLGLGNADLSVEVPPGASSKDVRSRLSLRALEALSVSVHVLVDACFLEDKALLSSIATASLSPAVTTLKRTAAKAAALKGSNSIQEAQLISPTNMHERQRNAEEELDHGASLAAADILVNLAKRDWGARFARRELVGLLDDPNFFFGKHGDVLSRLATVVSETISAGGAAALLSSIGSTMPVTATGLPGLFTGRDSESTLRARAVRRVAFCVFVSEPDHYLAQLPGVLERLRDSLRLAEPGLVVQCLLCLRVLLLRTGPASIAAFRATTLSEMFRIASEPTKNLSETLATLQFLDLVTLISPPDFGYVRCFFFSGDSSESEVQVSYVEQVDGAHQPLVPRLTALCKPESQEAGDASSGSIASPLRLEAGRTVFPGVLQESLTEDFIGRYAALLEKRNRSPAMASSMPDFVTIGADLELEFSSRV